MTIHQPVLLDKVIEYLNPKPKENFVDCTVGAGGHSLAILQKNSPGKVLAIDCDPQSLKYLKAKIRDLKPSTGTSTSKRLILVNDNFKNLEKIVQKQKFKPVSGILFDLGLSSWHLEKSKRGFSFKNNEPLKMGFSPQSEIAAKVINQSSEKELAEIFKQYGEERYSYRIARAIKKAEKPIYTTEQLRTIIKRAVPYHKTKRGQINRVLARIFQALRIVVNDELENLKQGLEQGIRILEPRGRMAVISFHSLEDRIVKHFFKQKKQQKIIEILTKKPTTASQQEVENNPRSRSAKLRAIIKT